MYVVYVLNQIGEPLMPTTRFGKVRRMLRDGLAKVKSVKPFVIQLQYETTNFTQPLYGGTDPGRTNIGEAVINQKGEVMYSAYIETRNAEIPKLMQKRKIYRQASRRGERLRRKRRAKRCGTMKAFLNGRKLPGFKNGVMQLKDIINSESRFNNRKRPAGWLTPTANQLVQTHINLIKHILKILPVTHWTIEYNKFAFMKLDDGTIRSMNFQNGKMKGFKSVKDYIYSLQDGKCAKCGQPIEHYHHIVPRHKGGSDTPENLIGLCKKCHEREHTEPNYLKEVGLKKKYAGTSIVNITLPYIYDQICSLFGIDNVFVCDGYHTKELRDKYNIEKEHFTDALCIASIGAKVVPKCDSDFHYNIKQFRNHDRSIINSQRERTYKYDGALIAKNRKPRFEQGEILALSTWYEKNSRVYGEKMSDRMRSKVDVIPSTRRYNNLSRQLPGVVFTYRGNRYVMNGQLSNGQYYRAYGEAGRNFASKECYIGYLKQSLTYL